MTDSPIILWFRRDLRLADNPMLAEAAATGRPLIPVFIHDDIVAETPAAPRWRWGLAVEAFGAALGARGSRLILRRGDAAPALLELARQTGAGDVWWSRLYGPDTRGRDEDVKERLRQEGLEARSFEGHLMREPWIAQTKSGGFFKVFTPMWRAVKDMEVPKPAPSPDALRGTNDWPASDDLADWGMGDAMHPRGIAVVSEHVCVGEEAARERLARFVAERMADYATMRDVPGTDGTSGLSENLTYGEIGIREVWHSALGRYRDPSAGGEGRETFLKELAWREFAYHLLHHTPRIAERNWRGEWDAFPWRGDNPEAEAWKRGRTGMRFVDAAMREMWVKGTMHNRGRMIVASYLTKHLMTHWKLGCDFFADHLIDWDIANNALGWQWSAGSGPDATPFFRVFNPESQLEKFDPDGIYAARWIAEGQDDPPETARAFFDAIPESWDLSPDDAYPDPVVGASEGRRRALEAYEARDF
ncbi:deoxyribodipyrimidine photo-lyase [Hasllibacter halocynthiae]|uniref:Deoxyribodipyrimidine photo-lyase n=1 Tax=Hasllibacter halocynthiae TaxID=595589 RepID=A0A2T0X8L1_9RHOB|nr:deoxyribodipyrimidine photo-lyase [Hasllibacter halocynthiae]PRY95281.1 deoxyribodipyrimidine photo-lyase [Hasllibacter halocynthiae]